MNDFLTIYRKDYTPKKLKSLKYLNEKYKLKNKEFGDPIAESFKHYLKVEPEPCNDELSEEVDSYYEKAKSKYNWLEDVTNNKPTNKDAVKKNQIYEGRTVYQVDYCDLEKEIADKIHERKNAVTLSHDVDIPLTSQRAGYRNPIMLNSRVYEKISMPKLKNNLEPNYKLRKILNVTTGNTEYMGTIGKLGDRIIIEQLHGVINHDI